MEYKIQKRKLMEYQRLMKMNEARLTLKVTMQTMEMGSRKLVDDTRTIMEKYIMMYRDVKIIRYCEYD